MERTVLLIKPEQRKKLNLLAQQENVSVDEINRRAIDFYIETPPEEIAKLNMLAETLSRSSHQAQKALEEAELAITETLNSIRSHQDVEQD